MSFYEEPNFFDTTAVESVAANNSVAACACNLNVAACACPTNGVAQCGCPPPGGS
jgi:hypothetical protein